MRLPFSEADFLDVFGRYNTAFWPAALVLWLASGLALLVVLRHGTAHRLISGLIVVQWAWAGIVYQFLLFARINPAARLFGALFLLQAALMTWAAWSGEGLRYAVRGPRRVIGTLLAAYGLLYPFLAVLVVHPYPRTPTFGVPCPTTLLTTGLLLMAMPPRRALLVIPLLWCLVGGSAAILLGVAPDFALLVAAAVLLLALASPRLLDDRHDVEAMFR